MQTKFNPNKAPGLSGEPSPKATDKQLALLRRLGHAAAPPDLESLTMEQADELIKTFKQRLEAAKERILQNTNLIDLAGRRVELRKESSREFSGPCPHCGGTDRFHVKADAFMCRKCHPKWSDAIEYTSWLEGVDYYGAIMRLDNGATSMPVVEKIKPVAKAASTSAYVWDEPKRRQDALDNHALLLAGESKFARAALEYLQGRGIGMDAAKAFKLGCDAVYLPGSYEYESRKQSYPKKVAISLPWFNHDHALMCVKYRYLESHIYTDVDGKERKENKTSRGSSLGHVFGWQALSGPDKCDVLIICEGEMNAISIWQAGQGLVDVLSAGSESVTTVLPIAVIELAKQYKYRIVWADKGDIADAAALSIRAASMRSPKGKDANDWLQAGKLGDLLFGMLQRMGWTQPEPPPPPVQPDAVSAAPPGDSRPLLPREHWRTGLATYADARRIQLELCKVSKTWLGRNHEGFYVVAVGVDLGTYEPPTEVDSEATEPEQRALLAVAAAGAY